MPLTPLQKDILTILAGNRSEESHFAAGIEQPDLPIGVAFVDAAGKPGWMGDDPSLRLHAPSVRGCWPLIHGLDP